MASTVFVSVSASFLYIYVLKSTGNTCSSIGDWPSVHDPSEKKKVPHQQLCGDEDMFMSILGIPSPAATRLMSVPISISGPIYSLIHSFFHQMLLESFLVSGAMLSLMKDRIGKWI